MAGNFIGFNNTANISGATVNAPTTVGENNRVSWGANPTVTDAVGNNPIPSRLPVKRVLQLSEKLEKRLKELREEGASTMALKEFLRPHLAELHDRTVNADRLSLHLHSAKVLSDYQRKKIIDKKIESEKNDLLYDYVGLKDAAKELVDALNDSENYYILQLLDKWASNPNM